MRDTFRIACLSLSLMGVCAYAVTPPTGGNTTGTAAGANSSRSTSAGGNGTAHHSGGNDLLCAGLLGSGVLSDVFTVAASRHEDPNDAIQFAPVWSDSHQATVGSTPPAAPPQSKLAVATIKLPIAFSETDRQRFVAAGWKAGASGMSYCLNRTARSEAGASPAARGMICVTATAP